MKKFIFNLLTLTMTVTLALVLTACPADGPDSDGDSDIIDPSAFPTLSEMNNLISKHVRVNVSYSNYYWTFKVESTLHQALHNRKIEFGIGHGDVNGNTNVSVGTQLNGNKNVYDNYSEYYDSNGVFHATLKCPIEYYYMFGKNPQDLNAFSLCQLYNRDFHMRYDKGESNWTAEDRERIPELRNLLRSYENEVLANYDISLQIELDKKKIYPVGFYNR